MDNGVNFSDQDYLRISFSNKQIFGCSTPIKVSIADITNSNLRKFKVTSPREISKSFHSPRMFLFADANMKKNFIVCRLSYNSWMIYNQAFGKVALKRLLYEPTSSHPN